MTRTSCTHRHPMNAAHAPWSAPPRATLRRPHQGKPSLPSPDRTYPRRNQNSLPVGAPRNSTRVLVVNTST